MLWRSAVQTLVTQVEPLPFQHVLLHKNTYIATTWHSLTLKLVTSLSLTVTERTPH